MSSTEVCRAWQLRQKLIAEEVCRRGDFDNEAINAKVREMCKNEEDFNTTTESVKPFNKRETVVEALRKVL